MQPSLKVRLEADTTTAIAVAALVWCVSPFAAAQSNVGPRLSGASTAADLDRDGLVARYCVS